MSQLPALPRSMLAAVRSAQSHRLQPVQLTAATPTALIVEKSKFCEAQPAASTAFMTLDCATSPGPLSGVYQLSVTSIGYFIKSVQPRGKPTPAP
jgi:hypothetical protein